MKTQDVKELFRAKAKEFFTGSEVIFARQSRIAKPEIPLVVITFGNVRRPVFSNRIVRDGIIVDQYQSRLAVTVDLFTHGEPVKDYFGTVVAYENTAVDEMLAFCDYLNSVRTTDWSAENGIAILTEGEAQDLTGIVNDNNYEYRARQELFLYYTHDAETDYSNEWYFTEATASESE